MRQVVRICLDHAATGLRDEVEGSADRDLGDVSAAVPPVNEDTGDLVVGILVLLCVVLLAMVEGGQLGRRAELRPDAERNRRQHCRGD